MLPPGNACDLAELGPVLAVDDLLPAGIGTGEDSFDDGHWLAVLDFFDFLAGDVDLAFENSHGN